MPAIRRFAQVRRRRLRRARAGTRLGTAGALLLTLPLLLAGGLGSLISSSLGRLVRDLPPASAIETQFGMRGAEAFRPPVVYDRTNQVPLFEVLHPRARQRRWISLDSGGLPDHVVAAMLAGLDPTFWSNPGYEVGGLAAALVGLRTGSADLTLTQRLANAALLPPPEAFLSPAGRALQSALMASELTDRYSKDQILTWYLNSAYFGLWAYGLDAAALTYFGKHAPELSLAESALLAAAAGDPEANPVEAPMKARVRQREVLRRMVELGSISAEQERQAVDAPPTLQAAAAREGWERPAYADYLLASLGDWLGEGRHRSGLRVVSTLDVDLQLQSSCAAASQVSRLSLQGAASVTPAADGGACLAAGLLPPLRPGDAQVDHQIADWSLAVMDPATGEVLAALGSIDEARPAGPMLVPFVYLTALSRGAPAGSMLLDLPPQHPGSAALLGLQLPQALADYRGPLLLREALAGLYPGAAAAALESAGEEQTRRRLLQLGLELPANAEPETIGGEAEGIEAAGSAAAGREADGSSPEGIASAAAAAMGPQASLLELMRAYALLANQGRMQGAARPSLESDGPAVAPAILLRVEDGAGRVLIEGRREEQHVLSAQLAFLLTDMLSDETARPDRSSALEVGRPAAAVHAAAGQGKVDWTVGYTPQRIVGVWLAAAPQSSLEQIGALNGSASIWHGVLRYATAGLPPLGWAAPPGVSEVEVCDPSGLLPTPYCAELDREYFVQGTEPSHYDNLYQAFRINADTGKLATLFTPLEKVQEQVYLVLPAEAEAWARETGQEQPPQEYDPLTPPAGLDAQVHFSAPEAFAFLRGQVSIRGAADPDGFQYYRLQFGEGLNPGRWVQIGTDVSRDQPEGLLGTWNTTGLNGLYTLQLLVVLTDGQIRTAALPLTVDNEPPQVRWLSPADGEIVRAGELQLQAAAEDAVGIARVEYYAGALRLGAVEEPPYALHWTAQGQSGEIRLKARAYDLAGNWSESEVQVLLRP
jgi:membrane peptidoglycan carboxypeptidase